MMMAMFIAVGNSDPGAEADPEDQALLDILRQGFTKLASGNATTMTKASR